MTVRKIIFATILVPVLLALLVSLNGCGGGGGPAGSTAGTPTRQAPTDPNNPGALSGPFLVAKSPTETIDSYHMKFDSGEEFFVAPDEQNYLVYNLGQLDPGIHLIEITAYDLDLASKKIPFRLEINATAGLRYYTIELDPEMQRADPEYAPLFSQDNLELTRQQ